MDIIWDRTDNEISIKQGGPPPGCVRVGFFVVGACFVAVGVLFFTAVFDIPDLDDELPISVFSLLFGLFWCVGAINSRSGTVETTVVIDFLNQMVRHKTSAGDPEVSFPFSDIRAALLWETVTTSTTSSTTSSGSSTTKTTRQYSYRVYLLKKDGSVFWLYTFGSNTTAHEHLQLLLDRLKVSCYDEAGGSLSRTLDNPYPEPSDRGEPPAMSQFARIDDKGYGRIDVSLRNSQFGLRSTLYAAGLLFIFIGCPVWFFIANQPLIPGWFLIIPGVPLLFTLLGVFIRGRRYSLVCRPESLDVSVRFWFPPFQALLGKTVKIPATALKAVRLNRYDTGDFHLELGLEGDIELPRLTGMAFSSGAVRTLPRSAVFDELKHIGLWLVTPNKSGAGPTVADLTAIETRIQDNYGLDPRLG